MSETIPEFWETPTADPPVETRPLGWWILLPAVFGSLILPRRLGARIGTTSIGKIVLVHVATVMLCALVAVLTAASLEGYLITDFRGHDFAPSEVLRLPFVLALDALRKGLAQGGLWGIPIAVVPGTYLCLFLIAWLLMPLIAAGEPSSRAYWRALKLVLWSFVHLAAMLCVTAAGVIWFWDDLVDLIEFDDAALTATVCAGILFWTTCLLWLGSRYAGPADGPGWSRRRPLCTRCAYVLTGLPTDSRCPECGLEISLSLPESRTLPPWAQAKGFFRRTRAYLPTLWRILRHRRDFFTQLAVLRGRPEAIRFAKWTTWLIGVCIVLGSVEILALNEEHIETAEQLCVLAVILLATVVASRALLVILILLVTRFGWRDPRRVTVVACYASVWLLTLAFLVWVTVGIIHVAGESGLLTAVERLSGWQDRWLPLLLVIILASPALAALLVAMRRIAQSLHQTRFASA